MFNFGGQICHLGPLCFLSQPHTKYCLCPISKPPLLSHCSLSTLWVTFVSSTALKRLYLVIDYLLIDWFITSVFKHLQGVYCNAKLCLGCWAGTGLQGSGMTWGTPNPARERAAQWRWCVSKHSLSPQGRGCGWAMHRAERVHRGSPKAHPGEDNRYPRRNNGDERLLSLA